MARNGDEQQGGASTGAAVHTSWRDARNADLRAMTDEQFAFVRTFEVAPGDVVAADKRTRMITNLARSVTAVDAAAQRMLKDARRDGERNDEVDDDAKPDTETVDRYRAELSRRMVRLQHIAGTADLHRDVCDGERLADGDDGDVGTGTASWVMLGGRGSGKTFAGAFWLHSLAVKANYTFALVGPALHDVREVMVEGPSGLKSMAEGKDRPRWEAGRKRLVWPNSDAVAYAFSAEDPDSLRGPQFHGAWADEFCAWREPGRVLSNLRFGLRRGEAPQLVITTTPRPIAALKTLLAEPGTRTTRGATQANAENLPRLYLEHLRDLYAGTRLEAQEMEGLVVENEGALFRAEDIAAARGERPEHLERVVVAVDPPITTTGDACGIVAAGRSRLRGNDDVAIAYVLADRSMRGLTPLGWARRVVETAALVGADQIVAEANQGGDMVRTVLEQAGCQTPVKLVHATRGKRARAEPVAALYEQGRVVHCGRFNALEEELMGLGSEAPGHSPDRADALVWAVSQLLLDRAAGPRIRLI